MQTIKEMRQKTTAELSSEVKNLQDELMRLRFRKVTDDVENSSIFKQIKRNIARLKTVAREKELANGKSPEKTNEKG
jgi:large subunit ribosomal protein L29